MVQFHLDITFMIISGGESGALDYWKCWRLQTVIVEGVIVEALNNVKVHLIIYAV